MIELTKKRFADGVWQGHLTGAPDGLGLKVWRDGKRVEGLSVAALDGQPGAWTVDFVVPRDALGDAAAVFLFRMTGQVDPLASLTVLAGKALVGDPRSDLAALRSELELIKRVLRRGLYGPDAHGAVLRAALAEAEADTPETGSETVPESGADTSLDTGPDTGPDIGPELSPNAAPDIAPDIGADPGDK